MLEFSGKLISKYATKNDDVVTCYFQFKQEKLMHSGSKVSILNVKVPQSLFDKQKTGETVTIPVTSTTYNNQIYYKHSDL